MTEFKKTLCEEGRELLEKYKSQGDSGLISGVVEETKVDIEEIVDFVEEKIRGAVIL
jgi:hypothetical protein